MTKIVECVPNISAAEPALVGEARALIENTPGVMLLDVSSDLSHNRSVLTFAGSPAGAEEAAVQLAKFCAARIDLREHRGEHPRMGALDVVPFIPIRETTLEECVALSRRAGGRIYAEAGIPVFLYEASASAPHRINLADVRRGQFEGMAEKLLLPEWAPDFGGREIHPGAGVAAVGARMPLVAFNINLSTGDLAVAERIARIIRRSSGGLACVKAIGVLLGERNVAQVSINMTDTAQTPLYRVVEFVRFEAARYGVSIIGTEIVGLVPMRALVDSAEYYLGIECFDAERQVLERRLETCVP